jgi:diguanylate cyclase (GGDEF)-like protein
MLDAVRLKSCLRRSGWGILIVAGLGLGNSVLDHFAGTYDGAYTHLVTGSGLVLTAAYILWRGRAPRLFDTYLPLILLLVALQRIAELAVPAWFDLIQHPVAIDLLSHAGFHGMVSFKSAMSLLLIAGFQLSYPRSVSAALFFLASFWMFVSLTSLEFLYDIYLWDKDLSAYSQLGFILAAIGLGCRFANKSTLGRLFAPDTDIGVYVRSIILASAVVPWATGLLYLQLATLSAADKALAQLLFAASGWITCAIVIVVGHRIEQANAVVEEISNHDSLTGVLNRRGMEVQLKAVEAPAGIIVLDLDRFKSINDRFGHQLGDRILMQAAIAIQDTLRSVDSVARWGGEEFLVLLPGADTAAARQIAERIRCAIEELVLGVGVASDKLSIEEIRITVSQGCAQFDPAHEAPDEAIHRADVALYRAKEAGRNRVEIEPLPCDIGSAAVE